MLALWVGQWKRIVRYALSVPLGLLLLLTLSQTVRADAPVVVGDGTPASCTPDALNQAIARVPAGGTITFNCGSASANIFVSDVVLDKDMTIDGGGLMIFTGYNPWLIGAKVNFLNLTITGASGDAGGPIDNRGTLTLHNVILRGNSAGHGSGGGAIGNGGMLTIEDSLIADNFGGCNIGSCGSGGAIANAGTMHIVNTTLSGNRAGGYGGAIVNYGTATIENSTLAGNTSSWIFFGPDGGAIANYGTLRIVNSTVSGNSAGGNGGGIFNAGMATIQNSTIANNSIIPGPFPGGTGGGVANANTLTIQNSILAGNLDVNNQPSDCSGTLTSGGFNLIQSTAGCAITGVTLGNVLNQNAVLGPLQDNGGPTFTHALLPTSPAIDAGSPAVPGSGASACELKDQRGVTRPQDGDGDGLARCDIGAVEMRPMVLTVPIDIKPLSSTNPIQLKSKGVVPVAILSTATFDATTVDVSTVEFGPGAATPTQNSLVDVNSDGRLDLLLHFRIEAAGIRPTDTQACLNGETNTGSAIYGCDTIHVVK